MVPVRCLLKDPSILDNLAQSLDRVKVTRTSKDRPSFVPKPCSQRKPVLCCSDLMKYWHVLQPLPLPLALGQYKFHLGHIEL